MTPLPVEYRMGQDRRIRVDFSEYYYSHVIVGG